MSNSEKISQDDLYASIPDIPNPELKTHSTFFYSGEEVDLDQKIDELQKQYIETALEKTGNLSQAAELLMINSYQHSNLD
ncbi:MAG: helix-turn-helix domain-containing protein [Planctomycetota bacterium]